MIQTAEGIMIVVIPEQPQHLRIKAEGYDTMHPLTSIHRRMEYNRVNRSNQHQLVSTKSSKGVFEM